MLDFDDYLHRLASADPTPGGGSAAALCGAMGAALVAMVARITRENPRYEARHAFADRCIGEADALRNGFLEARTLDEAAYGAVVEAMALPRATDEEKAARTARLQAALAQAAGAPLAAVNLCAALAALTERALDLENANLASDLGCAAEFARAALASSALNVRINHKFLKNDALIAEQRRVLDACERAASDAGERVRTRVSAAIG